jgi:hypothetical protein
MLLIKIEQFLENSYCVRVLTVVENILLVLTQWTRNAHVLNHFSLKLGES